MYKCEKCGNIASSEDKFCQQCGGRVINVGAANKTCAGCGGLIGDDDMFCPNCGMKAEKTVLIPPAEKKDNTKLLIIIVIIVAVIALGLGGVFMFLAGAGGTTEVTDNTASQYSHEFVTPMSEIPVTAPPEMTPNPMSFDISDEDGYLFPSNTTYITETFLDARSKDEVRLILNEIYARHGYTFETAEFARYFNSKIWYAGRGKSMTQCEAEFNDYERTNKETIVKYETARGWR